MLPPEERWYQDYAFAAACDALHALELAGKIDKVSPETKRWWTKHKKHDAERLEGERREKLRGDMRTRALSKLSAAERKILGLE